MAKVENATKVSKETSPPAQEKDSHAGGEKTSKFIGDSAGNADRNINLSGSDGGGMEGAPCRDPAAPGEI